jgi:hypothetical protein
MTALLLAGIGLAALALGKHLEDRRVHIEVRRSRQR